jgi:hypothetical protein
VKHIIRNPPQQTSKPADTSQPVSVSLPPGPASFDAQELYDRTLVILHREVMNLMSESSSKKLSATSARDLVAYIKLLHEVINNEQAVLGSMSDEELKKLQEKS